MIELWLDFLRKEAEVTTITSGLLEMHDKEILGIIYIITFRF